MTSDPHIPHVQQWSIFQSSSCITLHVGRQPSTLASSDRSWFSSLIQDGNLTGLTPKRDGMCPCAMTDFISQTSSKPGGPRSNNYNSEDDDERLLITRKNPSPTGCVDLLTSFDPHPCTSPDSRSSYSGSLCN